MPIESICKGCARKLRVADEHAGRKARCPHCGTIYTVPGTGEDDEYRVAPHESDRSETPTTPPHDVPNSARPTDQPQSAFSSQPQSHSSSPVTDQWQMRTSDGKVYGPVQRIELDAWVAQGRVPPDAHLFQQGSTHWRPSVEVYPSLSSVQPAKAGANPFADQDSMASNNPYQTSQYGRQRYAEPHRGGLILTLGILGWVLGFLIGCGAVLGPVAWALGRADLKKIREGQMDPEGQGLTQAGMILGMIQTILLLLGCGCVGLMILADAM